MEIRERKKRTQNRETGQTEPDYMVWFGPVRQHTWSGLVLNMLKPETPVWFEI